MSIIEAPAPPVVPEAPAVASAELLERWALEWANHVRRELGLEPVDRLEPGRAGSMQCPIAETICAGTAVIVSVGNVTTATVWLGKGDTHSFSAPTPLSALRFMGVFDCNKDRFAHLRL